MLVLRHGHSGGKKKHYYLDLDTPVKPEYDNKEGCLTWIIGSSPIMTGGWGFRTSPIMTEGGICYFLAAKSNQKLPLRYLSVSLFSNRCAYHAIACLWCIILCFLFEKRWQISRGVFFSFFLRVPTLLSFPGLTGESRLIIWLICLDLNFYQLTQVGLAEFKLRLSAIFFPLFLISHALLISRRLRRRNPLLAHASRSLRVSLDTPVKPEYDNKEGCLTWIIGS